jgi:AraC-like DNA-binding protein
MIYIAGISIALFISALILNKKNKSKSDFILFIWMLLIAAHLYLYYINFTGSLFEMPHLLGIDIPLPLIHGVFLYFYVSSVTNQFPKKNWIVLLHLLPISIGYIYLIPFFLSSAEEKLEIFKNPYETYGGYLTFGLILIFLSGIVYVIWSSILLRNHKKNIRNQFSDIEEINLRWLQFLTYGLGVVWCIVIFTNNDSYIFFGVTVFVILIGFFGVQQRTIFSSEKETLVKSERKVFDVLDEKKKYAQSGLTDELAQDIYKELVHLFTKEGYYKKNELSLNELALELGTHPNYLSQIINEKEGKSFYDFVNSFRVEEFKRLVKDSKNKQFTLLALAYDCGFNSKSSFNRYFKKNTGKTPSEFVKSDAI